MHGHKQDKDGIFTTSKKGSNNKRLKNENKKDKANSLRSEMRAFQKKRNKEGKGGEKKITFQILMIS